MISAMLAMQGFLLLSGPETLSAIIGGYVYQKLAPGQSWTQSSNSIAIHMLSNDGRVAADNSPYARVFDVRSGAELYRERVNCYRSRADGEFYCTVGSQWPALRRQSPDFEGTPAHRLGGISGMLSERVWQMGDTRADITARNNIQLKRVSLPTVPRVDGWNKSSIIEDRYSKGLTYSRVEQRVAIRPYIVDWSRMKVRTMPEWRLPERIEGRRVSYGPASADGQRVVAFADPGAAGMWLLARGRVPASIPVKRGNWFFLAHVLYCQDTVGVHALRGAKWSSVSGWRIDAISADQKLVLVRRLPNGKRYLIRR